MHQSPGRAAAMFRHIHASLASHNKLQHGVLPGTLSNTPKGEALCLQTLSQRGDCPAQLPWAPRTSANPPVAQTDCSPEFRHYSHTEGYSWSQKHRKIKAGNTVDFQQIKQHTCLNSNKIPIPIYLLPFLQDPETFLRLTSFLHSIGDLFSTTQGQSSC